MNEIRAAHVRASNFFGGPEKQILGHALCAHETPGTGIRVVVLGFDEKGRETALVERARRAGVEARSIPCLTAYDPGQILRLKRSLAEVSPDVVCTHDYRSTLLCSIALHGSGIPEIAFWRGVTRENLKVRLFHRLERRVLGTADHVVVVSQEQRSFLTGRGFPLEKVTLVPNAVDVLDRQGPDRGKRLESVVGKLEGQIVLATASRLSPEKGQSHLLDAMPGILRQNGDVTLLVFGHGPLGSRLRSQVARLGCAGNVRFAGLVPDFASLVGETDIFVLPSLSEGLPNALLEAMAAARPVVATRVGGVTDLLRDGENGLVVPPADSEALASAVLRLASDSELAGRLGRAAQATVRSRYSFAAQCELLRIVYGRVSKHG